MEAILPSSNAKADHLRDNVRFTEDEYLRIKLDEMESGRTIPWLLKTAYFKRGTSRPTLDIESRKAVRRGLTYIGKKSNQLAKQLNSGLISSVKGEVEELLQLLVPLKSFLCRDMATVKILYDSQAPFSET